MQWDCCSRGEQRRKLTKTNAGKIIAFWPSFEQGVLHNLPLDSLLLILILTEVFCVTLGLVCAIGLLPSELHPGVNLCSKPVRLLSGSSRLPRLNTLHTPHSHCLFLSSACHRARAFATQIFLTRSCPPYELHTSSQLHNGKQAIVLVEFPL